MTTCPHYRRLDDDLFPELQFGPWRTGIRALLLDSPIDPRVPAPAQARVLLVVFRVELPVAETPTMTEPQGWHLTCDRRDANGTLRLERMVLAPEPLGDDGNTRQPPPDTGPPIPGSTYYRGAWWTDLSRLVGIERLPPGAALEVGYGGQATATVLLPGG